MNVKDSYLPSIERLISAYGMENIIAVETADAVLVARKGCSRDIEPIVTYLEFSKRGDLFSDRIVYKPWGKYEIIESGDRFLVKKITINIGAEISLQKHNHRGEHWVVVKGRAHVNRGGEEFIIKENESIYISVGEIHRLKNVEKIPLEIIEIQFGEYIGEDDIIRLEDNYGRVSK